VQHQPNSLSEIEQGLRKATIKSNPTGVSRVYEK